VDPRQVDASPASLSDADVPAWWTRLGLPGLIDLHTHFMPTPVMDAVWRYFDNAREHYGLDWPVHYRGDEQTRIDLLRAMGVRAFPALIYPHKPGMAEGLNAWALDFAARVPDSISTATFYPEPSAVTYVRAALAGGTRIFKVHVQVGDYDPREPALAEVWGMISDAKVPVVVHCGSGPMPGRHTGPGPFGEVLAAHPQLTAIIAHAGAPEYDEHADLVERYANVYLDTTMVATDFMNSIAAPHVGVVQRWLVLQDRIVLGSDFPNIPYAYGEQLTGLERLGLGDDWLRDVCWHNGARLMGIR
jgi:predicted TIM-barrel fold metal-dependent hydrolase